MRRRRKGVDFCLLTKWEGERDEGSLNMEESKGEEKRGDHEKEGEDSAIDEGAVHSSC